MTVPQIISLVAAGGVVLMYLWPHLKLTPSEPVMLHHIRNIIDVRDTYKTPAVTEKCNALMEVLLGIKP